MLQEHEDERPVAHHARHEDHGEEHRHQVRLGPLVVRRVGLVGLEEVRGVVVREVEEGAGGGGGGVLGVQGDGGEVGGGERPGVRQGVHGGWSRGFFACLLGLFACLSICLSVCYGVMGLFLSVSGSDAMWCFICFLNYPFCRAFDNFFSVMA